MNAGRCKEITRFIKRYDRELYCDLEDGLYLIKRNGKRAQSFEYEGATYTYFVDDPFTVTALTHNWSVKGRPTDWGLDKIMSRIQESDGWNRDVWREIKDHNQKVDESKRRSTRSEIEAWAADSRNEFKEAFKDINTSTVSKFDRRRIKDKSIKN